MASSLVILKPGLQSTVQELPGRVGWRAQGFPTSGPMDDRSFSLANALLRQDIRTAALEFQLTGATLRFTDERAIAITGANMHPRINGHEIPMWQTHFVKAGDVIQFAAATDGMRTYMAVSGGIDIPPVLGSRATSPNARIGGYVLTANEYLKLNEPTTELGIRLAIRDEYRPTFGNDETCSISVIAGPDDRWLTDAGMSTLCSAKWQVQSKSDRTGIRLSGPSFEFKREAYNKAPEHGSEPSNILDHPYPIGGVNIAGDTPIIMVRDSPTTGGFIVPVVVASGELWKAGQIRPNTYLQFRLITLDDVRSIKNNVSSADRDEAIIQL